jgi:hypothetical protein
MKYRSNSLYRRKKKEADRLYIGLLLTITVVGFPYFLRDVESVSHSPSVMSPEFPSILAII